MGPSVLLALCYRHQGQQLILLSGPSLALNSDIHGIKCLRELLVRAENMTVLSLLPVNLRLPTAEPAHSDTRVSRYPLFDPLYVSLGVDLFVLNVVTGDALENAALNQRVRLFLPHCQGLHELDVVDFPAIDGGFIHLEELCQLSIREAHGAEFLGGIGMIVLIVLRGAASASLIAHGILVAFGRAALQREIVSARCGTCE